MQPEASPHRCCAVGFSFVLFFLSRVTGTYLGGAVGASLVGGLLAQLADGIVGTLGGLPAGGRRRAEATTAAAASGLGQHLRRSFYPLHPRADLGIPTCIVGLAPLPMCLSSFRHLFFLLLFLFFTCNQK